MALGNSASDLITNILSLKTLGDPAQALGEVIGAGLFSFTIVIGSVVVTSGAIQLSSSIVWKDLLFYLLGLLLSGTMLSFKSVAWLSGPLMLGIYALYVALTVMLYWFGRTSRSPIVTEKENLEHNLLSHVSEDNLKRKPIVRSKQIIMRFNAISDAISTLSFDQMALVLCAYRRLLGHWPDPLGLPIHHSPNFNDLHRHMVKSKEISDAKVDIACPTCGNYVVLEEDGFSLWKIAKYHYFPILSTWDILSPLGRVLGVLYAPLTLLFGATNPVIEIGATSPKPHSVHRLVIAQQLFLLPTFFLFAFHCT